MKVLLSIKPEYADKIFSGEKMFEFRKAVFRDQRVNTVVVYATMPVGKVIGEFSIAGVHEGTPDEIWAKTKCQSGITQAFYSSYFKDRKKAYAIEVSEATIFKEALTLKDFWGERVAPQSFAYL